MPDRQELEAQVAALSDRLASAEQAQCKSAHDLDAVQAELGAAQRRAERAEAEAALARHVLAELRVAPPGGGSGWRRKNGGPAPTAPEAPERLDEQREDEQGALTAASNPDDGSDSSDDGNDSKN